MRFQPRTAWILTDGKVGDLFMAQAVAQALGLAIEDKRIQPRRPWSWIAPWGPAEKRLRPGHGSLVPPYPDLLIATGRRTVPTTEAFTRLRGERPFTVFLKNPRRDPRIADFVWAPLHDAIEGANVLKTLTAPHRFSTSVMDHARTHLPSTIEELPAPRLAVLLGGPSRRTRFDTLDVDRLAREIAEATGSFASVMVTTSRRTPEGVVEHLKKALTGLPTFIWTGEGDNPYSAMLAAAGGIIVTGDSHNMVSDAMAPGVPVRIFRPASLDHKLETFLDRLFSSGYAAPLGTPFTNSGTHPIDSASLIAKSILEAQRRWTSRESRASDRT